ncbi:MAG: response regulator [Deltaproteobacteria bacterium]|nr:response regulator [Deltaproteobacteria bacterium]
MHALDGCRILLVEDDPDTLFLLGEGLRGHGAEVLTADSGEHAMAELGVWHPSILMTDLSLPGMDGTTLLSRLRERSELAKLPGIALTGHGDQAHRDASGRAGFAKHLLKPTRLTDLIVAIQAVEQSARDQPGAPRELPAILAEVNHASPCRFTSLLRFNADETLTSVWTYDRENPGVDPFPLELPIHASYCVLVRATGTTCSIENARTDPRTASHPKRDEQSTYIGVPVFRPDGQLYGTVCSYDPRPLVLGASVQQTIEGSTRELEAIIVALGSA